MKELTTYARVVGYLNKIFKAVNEEYFDNELPMPTITVQSSARSYGHVTTSKVWKTEDGRESYELNVSADHLVRPIESVVSTVAHEASHIYNMEHGIHDVSANGYHTRAFKKTAEEKAHLIITKDTRYGYTLTEPSEDTLNFIIANGFEDIKIGRESDIQWTFGGTSGNTGTDGTKIKPPRKPSSTRKYICSCGTSIRATKDVRIICADCMKLMVKVD